MRLFRWPCLALFLLVISVTHQAANAAPTDPVDPRLDPVAGTLVLASGDGLPEGALRLAATRAGGIQSRLVVLTSDPSAVEKTELLRWEQAGTKDVSVIAFDQIESGAALRSLLRATAVWVADMPAAVDQDLLAVILEAVRARGGVVCALNESAGKLVGLGALPGASIKIGQAVLATDPALAEGQVPVTWELAEDTAMVVHRGRRVSAVGEGGMKASVPATRGWASAEQQVKASGLDAPGASPSHDFDLLRWNRSALLRESVKQVQPEAAEPRVASGSLLICGGSRTTDAMYDAFIEAAGGKDAKFVYIPTASTLTDVAGQNHSTVRRLQERGCENVVVFHTIRRFRAQHDPALLDMLEQADGVFLGGGRTYRYVDAYLGTQTQDLLRAVLDRGGVVAGSSAGAQILGELLVRGDPRTNQNILFHGYTDGFGFLPGVAIDAHFTQRERQEPFFNQVLKKHEQLLGIGIDENTSILVRGSTAQVIGEHAVVFYDLLGPSPDDAQGTVLKDGEAYDLVDRRRIDTPPSS